MDITSLLQRINKLVESIESKSGSDILIEVQNSVDELQDLNVLLTQIETNTSVGNATSNNTSVASSASNVTLLASNANRKGATIFNDSTQILYVKLGATASTSSYTVEVQSDGYYEVPFNYTGIIDGIWASANGNARITEISI